MVEVGVVIGVGDDAHGEGPLPGTFKRCRGAAHGERNTIDGHGAFIDSKVAATNHLCIHVVLEGELIAAILILHTHAACRLIDMALHDVPVQASAHLHGAFHVHLIADLKQSEIRALQRLAHGGDGVGVVLDAYDGEAHTVVRDTLIYFQLIRKGAAQGEMQVVLLALDGHDGGGCFNDS